MSWNQVSPLRAVTFGDAVRVDAGHEESNVNVAEVHGLSAYFHPEVQGAVEGEQIIGVLEEFGDSNLAQAFPALRYRLAAQK
ncbi:MAG: hypothetical protein WA988_15975, partial [Candidatus Nanopelagicales bacterium]